MHSLPLYWWALRLRNITSRLESCTPGGDEQTETPVYQHPTVQLAARLPHGKTTASAGWAEHFQRHPPQNRLPMTQNYIPRAVTKHIVKSLDDTVVLGLTWPTDRRWSSRWTGAVLTTWLDKAKETHPALLHLVRWSSVPGSWMISPGLWTLHHRSKGQSSLSRMVALSLPPPILTTFYSILTGCSACDWKSLWRVVDTAKKIIGASHLHSVHCTQKLLISCVWPVVT